MGVAAVPLMIAVLNPAAMIATGIAEGPIEDAVVNVWMLLFGLGWATLGLALLRSSTIRS